MFSSPKAGFGSEKSIFKSLHDSVHSEVFTNHDTTVTAVLGGFVRGNRSFVRKDEHFVHLK